MPALLRRRAHAFAGDGAGHHVARGEFEQGVVALHEALAAIVAQVRALAAQGSEMRKRGAPGSASAVGWNW